MSRNDRSIPGQFKFIYSALKSYLLTYKTGRTINVATSAQQITTAEIQWLTTA